MLPENITSVIYEELDKAYNGGVKAIIERVRYEVVKNGILKNETGSFIDFLYKMRNEELKK